MQTSVCFMHQNVSLTTLSFHGGFDNGEGAVFFMGTFLPDYQPRTMMYLMMVRFEPPPPPPPCQNRIIDTRQNSVCQPNICVCAAVLCVRYFECMSVLTSLSLKLKIGNVCHTTTSDEMNFTLSVSVTKLRETSGVTCLFSIGLEVSEKTDLLTRPRLTEQSFFSCRR